MDSMGHMNMGPIFPPEIERLILSKLKKPDLLNCRTVCHSWDSECRRVLQLSNTTMDLTVTNLKEFLNFSRNSPTSLSLPSTIGLNFEITPRVFNLNVLHQSNEETEIQLNDAIEEIIEDLENLLIIYGAECVSHLRLRSIAGGAVGFRLMLRLLSLLSQGLRILNLERYNIRIWTEEAQAQLLSVMDEFPLMDFPKLKLLKLRRTCSRQEVEGIYIPFYRKLTSASPNIEEWVREYKFDPRFGSLPFDRLKVLKVGPLVDPVDFLDKLNSGPGPRPYALKHLTLNLHKEAGVHQEILQMFSATLNTLSLGLGKVSRSNKDLGNYIHFPPLMPALQTVRIKESPTDFLPYFVDPMGALNMRPEVVPLMDIVDVPFGLFFGESMDNPAPTAIFPKVYILMVRLTQWVAPNAAVEISLLQKMRNNWENLLATFPSVIKIVIVNEGLEYYIKHALKSLIQSTGALRVLDLEIQNCKENYLGQVLHQMKCPPRVILENFDDLNQECLRYMRLAFQSCAGGIVDLKVEKTGSYPGGDTESRSLTLLRENNTPFDNNLRNLAKIRMSYFGGHPLNQPKRKPSYFETIPEAFPHLRVMEISKAMMDPHIKAKDFGVEKFMPHTMIKVCCL